MTICSSAFTSSLAFLTYSLLQTPSTQFFIMNHVLEEQWLLLSPQFAHTLSMYTLSHLVPWFQLLPKCWVLMSTHNKDLSSEVQVQTPALYCISSHECLAGMSNTCLKRISIFSNPAALLYALYNDVSRDSSNTETNSSRYQNVRLTCILISLF